MNFFSLSNGLRLYYYNVHTPNNGMITAVYKKAFDVHFSMPFSPHAHPIYRNAI